MAAFQRRIGIFAVVFCVMGSFASAGCVDVVQDMDCNGDDIINMSGPVADMTTDKCCALCSANVGCSVSVLATGRTCGGSPCNECLLKRACRSPKSMHERIMCCSRSPCPKLPPPPPPPKIWTCDPILLPTFCNASANVKDRVQELLSQMHVEDKIANVGTNGAAGVPALGIPAFQWWGEALHGVCSSPAVTFQEPTPTATSFPEIIGVGATFDPLLWKEMGAAVGLEARVMMNVGNAAGTFWAPNLNIIKDPRWGRLQEAPSEDPWMTAMYGYNFVTGVQGDQDAFYLQASSCCKHYAAYSEENWHGLDRYHFDSNVSARDWADTYSVPFQACAAWANASGIMCSYNSVNGTPACANKKLLTELARDTWGFNGYITGDCGAAEDVYKTHHYTSTPAQGAAASLKAGMDVDCDSFLKANLAQALARHDATENDLDNALTHLFAVRIRLGLFDDQSPYHQLTPASVNKSAHNALALRAAQESLVVLKATHGAIAFPSAPRVHPGTGTDPESSTGYTVAVVGPNADSGPTMQGVDCHGVPPFLITPRMAFANYSTVAYAHGCDIDGDNRTGFDDAVAAANMANATVVVVGLDRTQEYEMNDRDSLLLPEIQSGLIETVCSAAAQRATPCTVVIISGGCIDTSSLETNPNVTGIVWAGYPGQAGGQAIADVLMGAVMPSGRLPVTWYHNNDIVNVSMWDMGMRPDRTSTLKYGRTHRFYTGTPLYKFGYGLQSTTFSITPTDTQLVTVAAVSIRTHYARSFPNGGALPSAAARSGAPDLMVATYAVQVKNTGGTHCSATSVLMYIIPPSSGSGDPLQSLRGVQRSIGEVCPGDTQTFSFTVGAADLVLADEGGNWDTRVGLWTVRFGNDGPVLHIRVV
eukprot:m.402257 g.402257  ORF g.402257 m.402257 type:complete len:875 (+) comp21176_c0_seq2:161-2785(+)